MNDIFSGSEPKEPVYVAQLRRFTADLSSLAAQSSRVIGDVVQQWPSDAQVSAVYLISTPDDAEVVYAGTTKVQVVADRFRDHLLNRNSSNLCTMVTRFPSYPQTPNEYRVRWFPIEEARERTFFESFVIGVLAPPFNR